MRRKWPSMKRCFFIYWQQLCFVSFICMSSRNEWPGKFKNHKWHSMHVMSVKYVDKKPKNRMYSHFDTCANPERILMDKWIWIPFEFSSSIMTAYINKPSTMLFSSHNVTLLHFMWVIDDAKCIVVTAVCVCLSVCPPLPHSQTTARTQM